MMQLKIQGKDITRFVGIASDQVIDGAGGQLDSVEITFADAQGRWSQWAPAIDDTIEIANDGFASGVCYIDQIAQERGLYVLRGLSVPSGSKQAKNRSWEKVTFLQLITDVAHGLGFGVSTYGIANPTYAWVDQRAETDLELLQRYCALEGCALKANGKKIIVYNEAMMEQVAPVRVIRLQDFWGDIEYRQQAEKIYAACVVSYGSVSGSFTSPGIIGDTLYVNDVYVTSIGEAQRFAKGRLRAANKNGHQLLGAIQYDRSLAGGSMVKVVGIGTADGIYMVDQVIHQNTAQHSVLRLRKKLEGY